MPDDKHLTINEEAGLPSNWVPLDAPPIVPSKVQNQNPDNSSSSSAPLVGSLPPGYQLDADFVRNAYRGQNVPNLSLMPLGIQGNPTSNAGIQSTAKQIVTQAIAAIPPTSTADVESIASNVTASTAYNVQLSDRDTLISLTNNAGGTVTLPGGSGNAFAFVQQGHVLNLASDLGTISMTNGQGNLMFLIVWSGRPGNNTSITISDTNGNIWIPLYTVADPGNTTQSAWYAQGVAAGANTITAHAIGGGGGVAQIEVTIAEYTGIKTSSALDAFSQAFNTSINITTVTPNDLVIFSAAGASGAGHSTQPPWTARFNNSFQIIQDQVVATAGTVINGVGANSPDVANGDPRALAAFKISPALLAAGFSAGWYTFIENIGTGTFTLQSGALIDNSGANVTIGPNQGLLVVYDGTNWFTERGINFPNGTTGSGAVVLQNSPTLTGTVALPIATLSGKITNYNSIATVSDGIPAEYATVDLTAQVAAIAATTLYAVPINGQGMYRVSWVAKVTLPATTSSVLGGANGFQLVYTDNDDSAVVTTPAWWGGSNNGAAPTSAAVNTTQGYISGCFIVNAKASTNIQYSIGYTSVGGTAMQYNLHIKLEAL
jgi:hypothetical protein